jgi:hypothetical protein
MERDKTKDRQMDIPEKYFSKYAGRKSEYDTAETLVIHTYIHTYIHHTHTRAKRMV